MDKPGLEMEFHIYNYISRKFSSTYKFVEPWGYRYFYVAAIISIVGLIFGKFLNNSSIAFYALMLIGIPWAVLMLVVIILLVITPYYECLKYLRKKEVPLTTARFISLLTNIGAIALLALLLKW